MYKMMKYITIINILEIGGILIVDKFFDDFNLFKFATMNPILSSLCRPIFIVI